MASPNELYDFQQFLQQQSSTRNSQASHSTGNSLSSWEDVQNLDTPATSPTLSARGQITRLRTSSVSSASIAATVTLSFTKGSKLFKLRYSQIDVLRDAFGHVQSIELSDPGSLSGPFVHTFPNSKRPVPHLEQPATSTQPSLCVSFLENSLVQLANTVFGAEPKYTFSRTSDCSIFQEAVLGNVLLFVAGVAEITSRGRGEETISQNLRVCRTKEGQDCLLFFTNAQRKDRKLYTTVLISDIEKFDQPRKETKPIQLKLATPSITDLGATPLVSLSVLFLDPVDSRRFCLLLRSLGIKTA